MDVKRSLIVFLAIFAVALPLGVVIAEEDWDDDFGFEDEEGGKKEEPAPEIRAEEVREQLKRLLEQGNRIRYEPAVDRDPFRSIIVTGGTEGPRPDGFPGFNVAELRLTGVIMGGNEMGNKAFFIGPDDKAYQQMVGDRAYNGKIIAVREDRVVFEEYQETIDGKPRPPKIVTFFLANRPQGR